ncbi:MAG TPA: dTDP-4-amino-4,6-dideoxygalactose transaminase [Gammaproteobacteria bacterium]|nr:dTDP-4-amino-4,6-dideoxygalactose transaminase [Gammaproteobacteria bacterium]
MSIRFTQPSLTGRELENIRLAMEKGRLMGNGEFTKRCQEWLEKTLGCRKVLLTHSCTAALEMGAILSNAGPGDEVIMPSFTFVSTANAFVLRGVTPVFVDVDPVNLNIDPKAVAAAVTSKTKAIVPVHYAGVPCRMDEIVKIAEGCKAMVVEDAAQSLLSTYKGRHAGTFGQLAAISFHETKNVVSGEGGALVINDPELMERAEIIWEKGTNRSKFFRGQVDKYTWVDVGSSFLPSELVAAFLSAQLDSSQELTARRLKLWDRYAEKLKPLFADGTLQAPRIPADVVHNGHIFFVLTKDAKTTHDLLAYMKEQGVGAVFHYIPLHSAPAGRKYGRTSGSLKNTEELADRLVRLPLFSDLTPERVDEVVGLVQRFFGR